MISSQAASTSLFAWRMKLPRFDGHGTSNEKRGSDRGLFFHSDRRSQYSSQAVRKPLKVIGANLSMSRLGNCYDNAKAESFFSTLKSECLPATQVFDSKMVARLELFEYIAAYYNNKRLHSALGTPRQFEVEHYKKGNNFFEEKVSATPFQKRSEVQESKRNKWKGPSRSVGSSPFMPVYDLERSEVF